MSREQIIGTWKSVAYTDGSGMVRPHDRQELTFRSDGTGNMHARTLFKRNTVGVPVNASPSVRSCGMPTEAISAST